jgi:hypothetical protein
MSPTGPKIRKGAGSSMPEASPDHPIYKRGFAIGVVRSTPSLKSTQAPASTDTKPNSTPTPETSSNPPQSKDGEDCRSLAHNAGRRTG